MSETDERPSIKVTDRRRVDPEGNPREAQGKAEAKGGRPDSPRQESAPQQPSAEPQPTKSDGEEATARIAQELEASRKRFDELARAYQALEKDREEFKQRLQRERDRLIDVEKGNVALTLLEAIDELDLCLSATTGDESPLAKGVRLIRDNLLRKLDSVGVERLTVQGLAYDPGTAEAVDMEITPRETDDGLVAAEIRAGYKYKDRVIRPARVKVARFVKPASA